MSVLTNDKLLPIINKYGLTPSESEVNTPAFQTALKYAYGSSAKPPKNIFDNEYTLAFVRSIIINETDPEALPDGLIDNKLAPRAEPSFASYFVTKLNDPNVIRAHTGPFKSSNQKDTLDQLKLMHTDVLKRCADNRKAGRSNAVKNDEFYEAIDIYKIRYPLAWKSMYIISSFGAFQTLGWSIHDFVFRDKSKYTLSRPFERVYDYYIEIEQNPELQFERFVQFCIGKSGANYKTEPMSRGMLNLYWAIRMGHVTSFAYFFNGPAYKTNRYDTKLTSNIKKHYDLNLAAANKDKTQEPSGLVSSFLNITKVSSNNDITKILKGITGKGSGPYLPIGPYRITSGFGPRIYNNKTQNHEAIDMVPKIPTANPPVHAMFDGTVAFAFGDWKTLSYAKKEEASGGNNVVLTHKINNRSITTSYLHLDKVQSYLKSGSKVRGGEMIGIMGTTGSSSAPHLHLSMHEYINNTRVVLNPTPYLEGANSTDIDNRLALDHTNSTTSQNITRRQTDKSVIARSAEAINKIKRTIFGSTLPDIVGVSGDVRKRTSMTNESFDYLKRLI